MLASSSSSSSSPALSNTGGQTNTGVATPVLQINDIRYHVFQLVMEYLYNGGRPSRESGGGGGVPAADVVGVVAAANFFHVPGLLKRCERVCARLVDLDSVVSYYIHARVYSAEYVS